MKSLTTKSSHSLLLIVLFAVANHVSAQTVQLPTIDVFSVGTTVLIPDQGAVYLGGVNRASMGSTTSGVPFGSKVPGLNRLFSNRGLGSSASSSSASVTATIINHAEWDEAILRDAAAARVARQDDPVARKAAFLSQHVGKRPPDVASTVRSTRPRDELVAATDRSQDEMETKRQEAAALMSKAEQAEKDGRLGTAKIFYHMASQRLNRDSQREIEQRITAITARQETRDQAKTTSSGNGNQRAAEVYRFGQSRK